MSDLISAAGYDVSDPIKYSSGWSRVKQFVKEGHIILEDIPGSSMKYASIPQDGEPTIVKHKDAVHMSHCYQGEYSDSCKYGEADCPAKTKEETKSEDKQPEVHMFQLGYQVVDVETVRMIESLASKFAWDTNSDSLREFVKSLK